MTDRITIDTVLRVHQELGGVMTMDPWSVFINPVVARYAAGMDAGVITRRWPRPQKARHRRRLLAIVGHDVRLPDTWHGVKVRIT